MYPANSMDSKLISLISQLLLSVVSTDSDSDCESESESDLGSEAKLISLISQLLLIVRKDWYLDCEEDCDSDSDPEAKLLALMLLTLARVNSDSLPKPESKLMPLIIQIFALVNSMDLDSMPKPESKLMSLVSQTISLFNSTDLETLPKPLSKLISLISQNISVDSDSDQSDLYFSSLLGKTLELKPYPELISLILLIVSVVIFMHAELKKVISLRIRVKGYFEQGTFRVTHVISRDWELKLVSLIFQLRRLQESGLSKWEPKIISLIIETFALVKSIDLDSQPKPESKLMSLVTQTISLFNSTDLESLPNPLSELISLISQKISTDSDQEEPESDHLIFKSLVDKTLELKPAHEIISLIRQIVSFAISMNSTSENLLSLCPQVKGYFDAGGKFSVSGKEELQRSSDLWNCFLGILPNFSVQENITYFHCRGCNGEYHKEYEKAPLKIKYPLHQKHSLQLALNDGSETTECYCCDKQLLEVFYCCPTCDCAMNIACVKKPRVLSIPNPKWHDHSLTLFPRKASLTCDVCALANSNSPFYICSPCDFVAHLKCINLPLVLKISRHPHRMRHTPCFEEGNWSCSVCRRKIDNDYGGYSCVKDGCSYAAHSRCATQSNVWDGIDLEGQPEEIEEEEVEPFVRISDGIIRHFSHEHHHLRLDDNTSRDYDDRKLCQLCIMPIYFGNLYSCLQCEFVLHETCANLPRKIYHPIHPHLLTLDLVGGSDDFVFSDEDKCLGCDGGFAGGFFYECSKEGCYFRLHVQCATIFEPLVHASHVHPLFLTSKPGDKRDCSVCRRTWNEETFNCIDECDGFALCFRCATLPQKVRYKHDKHILTLSYGQEETTIMLYWCEACESIINPKEGFYMCDAYCCVTLHIECLIGNDLYMKPGSSLFYSNRRQVSVIPNNHHMSRHICSICGKRCPQKIVFQNIEKLFCSLKCLFVVPVLSIARY